MANLVLQLSCYIILGKISFIVEKFNWKRSVSSILAQHFNSCVAKASLFLTWYLAEHRNVYSNHANPLTFKCKMRSYEIKIPYMDTQEKKYNWVNEWPSLPQQRGMRSERSLVTVYSRELRCAGHAEALGHWGVTKLWITRYLSCVPLVVMQSVPSQNYQ